MSADAGVVGVHYDILQEVIENLQKIAKQLDDDVQELEKLVPTLGEGEESTAARNVLRDAKSKSEDIKYNIDVFMSYMRNAGTKIAMTSNQNKNLIYDAYHS